MIRPPFIGCSDIRNFDIKDIMNKVDLKVLFKSRWKMARGGEEMLSDLLEDKRILASMSPRGVYGYFPVYRQDETLVLVDSVEWIFPEIKDKNISGYFNTKKEGGDIIPLTAVTIGQEAVELSREMHINNDYAEYFLFYGLAAECTEAIASELNNTIEYELGGIKTLRRSFGYPACPDLSYQRSLLKLLEADRIGVSLNESNQLVPEFSTTAFIIHSKLDQ